MASPRIRMFSSPLLLLICLLYISTAALAASTVLGLDFGTEYIKATLVKPGTQNKLVETKDTRRKEAASIAFKPVQNPKTGSFPERAYGSDAVALAARFPGDVNSNLKSLLGLTADNELVINYSSRYPALKLKSDQTRGTVAFQSTAFARQEEPWTVEELLAMQLQSIQKNAENMAGKGSIVKDLVVTVPTFYTIEEKRAIILAAELAGLRVLEMVSDGLAVGLEYATSRNFPVVNEGGKAEYHMVFDMGAGSTKATILRFRGRTVKDIGKFNKTIQEVHVMGSGWDRTLGGDALNSVIVEDMIAKFVETPAAKKVSATVDGVKAHGRAMAKLWKEAERLRQVLSANTNTQGSFEGLYEDVDFRYKISRTEFEELSSSQAARIGDAIEKAFGASNLEITDLDSIILHGGAIRTPFVLKELEKIIGSAEKLRTNVNADEAAVFGAGFRAATLSPSFRVKEIRAFDGASYAAGIKWTNVYAKKQHQRLWEPNAHIGAEKQYNFKNKKDFDILFYQHVPSSEKVSPGSAEKETMFLTTKNLTESVAILQDKFGCGDLDINLRLRTSLAASDGEVRILGLVADCEVEDTEKPGMVDSMKNMFGFGKKDQAPLGENGEPLEGAGTESSSAETASTSSTTSTSTSSAKTKTKSSKGSKKTNDAVPVITKRLEVIPIDFTLERRGLPALSEEDITRKKDRIAAFANSDRARKLREEALNQLEKFTYDVKRFLEDAEFVTASTLEERSDLQTKAEEAGEWIYTPDGRIASREELKAKLKVMEDIVAPIQMRKDEAAALPEQLKALKDALNATKYTIISVTDQIENDTKIHASWSSSKSASASSSPSPSPSPSTVDDFADLEDVASETVSAAPVEESPEPPVYTAADLIRPQELFDTITEWLAQNLPKQKAIKPTENPVILVKDVAAKAQQLQDIQVEIIMKSMKRPYKSSRPTTKPKTKPKTKKPKKSSKTTSAGKPDATMNLEEMVKNGFVKLGDDDGERSEEDILAFVEKQRVAAETERKQKEAEDNKAPEESTESGEGEKAHDEL